MKHHLHYIILLCFLLLAACRTDNRSQSGRCTVTCTLHSGTVRCDSATLLVLDDDYARLMVQGGARRRDSVFTFEGHWDRPQIAIIEFHTDSLPYSFNFVLEPEPITIDIEAGQWLIRGGRQNLLYQQFLNRCAHIADARDSLWKQYMRLGHQDSTLTWTQERQMLQADSVLQDSLQRIIVQRISQNDLVSTLIKQRLMPQLTQSSLERLRPEQ